MDLMTVIAVAGSAGTAICAYGWHKAREDAQFFECLHGEALISIKARDEAIAKMNDRLAGFEAAAFKRKKVLSDAGKKGRAVQIAKAAEVNTEARDKTLAEFGKTTMRSRARVVAPVKAARTRAQKKSAAIGAA